MGRKSISVAILLLVILLTSACSGGAPSAAPDTATEIPSPAPPTPTIRLQATATATPTPVPPTVTFTPSPSPTFTLTPTEVAPISISGTITNLEDAKKFLTAEAHLQLVRIQDDGKINFVIAQDGSMSLDSDLAQIPLPAEDGRFEFRLEGLEPGKYVISAQPFKPENFMSYNLMVIVGESQNPQSMIQIEINENLTLPYQLDLGEVEILLP